MKQRKFKRKQIKIKGSEQSLCQPPLTLRESMCALSLLSVKKLSIVRNFTEFPWGKSFFISPPEASPWLRVLPLPRVCCLAPAPLRAACAPMLPCGAQEAAHNPMPLEGPGPLEPGHRQGSMDMSSRA